MGDISELQANFKKLRDKQQSLKNRQLELETQLAMQTEERDKALAKLREDHGLSSIEEANQELEKLGKEIDSILDASEKEMSEYLD